MSKRWRLAIVVQRYGEEVSGGAELHARWLAEHMLALASVDVVTTCAVDYTTWADHYPPGVGELNGVKVRRFPVDTPRNWKLSQRQTFRLLNSDHSLLEELEWVRCQGPVSTPLLKAIEHERDRYDAFLFFTYLYATTFFGLPLVPEKALLVPTAHADPYLDLPVFRPLFHLPRAIVYNTETEKELVNEVMRINGPAQIVAGVGINVPGEHSGTRFREKYRIDDDFVLYIGRVDESKNVPELLDYFRRFRQRFQEPLKLVIVGKSHIQLPSHPDIVPVGFLSEQDKFDALKAAKLVVIPSQYESLSMAALEAWWMQLPVVVNGRCNVLKQLCRQSNAGLYYHSFAEFELILRRLLGNDALCSQLGRQGHAFVAANYHWDIVMAKYQAVLETLF